MRVVNLLAVGLAVSMMMQPVQAATPKKKAAAKPAAPQVNTNPYPGGEQLPPNYKGLNPDYLWSLLQRKGASMEKGEFETTEQFQARRESSAGNLAPLTIGAQYAFLLDETVRYDADHRGYRLKSYIFCKDAYSLGDIMVCCHANETMRFSEFLDNTA